MLRVMDVSWVSVELHPRAEELPLVSPSKPLKVACAVGAGTYKLAGTVDFVDPRADAASGLMRVKVHVAKAEERIKPGLRTARSLDGPWDSECFESVTMSSPAEFFFG